LQGDTVKVTASAFSKTRKKERQNNLSRSLPFSQKANSFFQKSEHLFFIANSLFKKVNPFFQKTNIYF
jgi:hypothetical protein